MSFSLGADYTDNLSGSLYQAIFPTGSGQSSQGASGTGTSSQISGSGGAASGGIPSTELNVASHAWNFLLNTNYAFAPNLQATGEVERRQQTYAGANYGDTLYGAGVFYTRADHGRLPGRERKPLRQHH